MVPVPASRQSLIRNAGGELVELDFLDLEPARGASDQFFAEPRARGGERDVEVVVNRLALFAA